MVTNLKPLPAWLDLDERKAKRLPMDFATSLTRFGALEPISARILDLSTDGCLLATPGRTVPGGFVTLTLPHSLTVTGWVSWSKQEHTGIDFAHALNAQVVNQLTQGFGHIEGVTASTTP